MSRARASVAMALCVGMLFADASADAAARTHPRGHLRTHPRTHPRGHLRTHPRTHPRGHLRTQIVGGQPVPAGALRQLAYIQDEVSPSSYVACTGTVVSANLVLTAGHCAQDDATGALQPASGFLVATGRPNLDDTADGQVSDVTRVLVYPGYDPTTHDGDVALLELSRPTTAPAIQLADSGLSPLWQPGTEVAVAGWGLTNGAAGTSPPTQVQWATTVIQSPDYCTVNALLAGSPFDSNGQLCAVDAPTFQTGACLGDSGGPMLANYGTADPIEVGITSWVVSALGTSCNTLFPTFFTQAAAISSWVRSSVAALAPPAAAPTPKPTPKPKPKPKRKAKPKPKLNPVRATAPRPRAGVYSGTSSQHRSVRLRVAAARTTIGSIRFSYRVRCRSGRRPTGVVTLRHVAISNLMFGHRFQRGGGATFSLSGRFDTTGAVSGTMEAHRSSARYGTCRSGTVRFKARR